MIRVVLSRIGRFSEPCTYKCAAFFYIKDVYINGSILQEKAVDCRSNRIKSITDQ